MNNQSPSRVLDTLTPWAIVALVLAVMAIVGAIECAA